MLPNNLPALPTRQPSPTALPAHLQICLAGMELVNLYIMGKLTLKQTNELLAASGYRRVLTIIEKGVR